MKKERIRLNRVEKDYVGQDKTLKVVVIVVDY